MRTPHRAITRQSESAKTPGAVATVVRVAAGPRSDMLGFLTIFAAALAGFAGLGPWVIAAAAIALASFS